MEELLNKIANINYALDLIEAKLQEDLTPEERTLKIIQYEFLERKYREYEDLIRRGNYENIDNRDNVRNRVR